MSRPYRFVALALCVLELLSGCATAALTGANTSAQPPADGRTAEQQDSDQAITAEVNAVLARDPVVPAMAIDVTTHDGVVSLTGHVPSYSVARRARALAAQVPGVEEIQIKLAIKP